MTDLKPLIERLEALDGKRDAGMWQQAFPEYWGEKQNADFIIVLANEALPALKAAEAEIDDLAKEAEAQCAQRCALMKEKAELVAAERERLAKLAEADGYLWVVRDDQSTEEKLEEWIRSQVKP